MTFTTEAQEHLEGYLEDIRASLGDEGDAAEVEQDVRDHIEAELGGHPSPISIGDLDAVLARLGNPHDWMLTRDGNAAAAIEAPRAMRGEEWLAYAACALLFAGFLLPFFLPASWLLARWTLARLEERGEDGGASRWLLYPPIAFGSIAVLLLALFWPFGMFAELGMIAAQRHPAGDNGHFPPLPAIAVAVGCLGIYWTALGALAAIAERAVRFIFHPFATGFRRQYAWWLSGAGFILAVVASGVFFGVPR